MWEKKNTTTFVLSFFIAVLVIFYILSVISQGYEISNFFKFTKNGFQFLDKSYTLNEDAIKFIQNYLSFKNDFYNLIVPSEISKIIKNSATSIFEVAKNLVFGIDDFVRFAIHGNM